MLTASVSVISPHDADVQFVCHATGTLEFHPDVNFKLLAIENEFGIAVISLPRVDLARSASEDERDWWSTDAAENWCGTQFADGAEA